MRSSDGTATKPVLTNRQRKLAKRGAKPPRDVATGLSAETRQSNDEYERRKARMKAQRKIAERMCIRHRVNASITVLYLDYRYWQCRSCQFNPLVPAVWEWWTRLHYRQREEIHAMSRMYRQTRISPSKTQD